MTILNSVKLLMGVPEEHTAFDEQLTMHINSVFMVLDQLGAGSFRITTGDETWEDYLDGKEDLDLEAVRSYMYLKVRMMFDPPTVAAASNAFDEMIKEYEWRLKIGAEFDPETEDE